MEDQTTLTAGQKAVVDAYLAMYEPSPTFDHDRDTLVDTQTLILEMDSMCSLDENALCDYLVSLGYCARYVHDDAISGWILRKTK